MRYLVPLFILLAFSPEPLAAQEITAQPICFTVRNASENRIYGEIGTAQITREDGQKIHHTGSFRLEPAGQRHANKGYLRDRAEFCSSGPFYPGRQLEFVLRTLIPVFSCKFTPELGEIVVQTKKIKQNGQEITKFWANCL